MQIREILNLVSDELRDGKATKYSRTSLLIKLEEGVTQFVQDSKILKNSILIPAVANQGVYPLPIYGMNINVISGNEAASSSASDDDQVPTYLSLIRLGWRDRLNNGDDEVLRSNSTFERDEAGQSRFQIGAPLYHYNDELSFYKFGVWPIPDSNEIAASGVDKRFQLDYVRDALYYTDAANTTLVTTSLTEDHYLDNGIPLQFQRKLYLLVCYLRLKNSIDPTDVQKAANYKALYESELLEEALRSGSHMERYNQLKVQS
jgi:hypothetical protein